MDIVISLPSRMHGGELIAEGSGLTGIEIDGTDKDKDEKQRKTRPIAKIFSGLLQGVIYRVEFVVQNGASLPNVRKNERRLE